MVDLSLNFIPFEHFIEMDTEKKIDLIINTARKKEIVVIEGLLKPDEEMNLIANTMKKIDRSFKGIEICAIPRRELLNKNNGFRERVKNQLLNLLVGKERGLTVIGPASIVKQIKRDPEKIVLKMK
jgi:hypothetical protein